MSNVQHDGGGRGGGAASVQSEVQHDNFVSASVHKQVPAHGAVNTQSTASVSAICVGVWMCGCAGVWVCVSVGVGVEMGVGCGVRVWVWNWV